MALGPEIQPLSVLCTSVRKLFPRLPWLCLFMALVLGLLVAEPGVAAPQEPAPLPQGGVENEVCLRCHTSPGLTAELPSGEELILYIDPNTFDESAHGRQGQRCTACHTNITGYPHPPLFARDRRDYNLGMYPLCRQCHGDKYAQTLDSMHAKALAGGDRSAAICTDCHGAHDVSDPAFPRAKISNTCAKCHSAIFNDYKESIHGAALLEESNPDVPTCIDCHGVHRMQDPRAPAFRAHSPEMCGNCHADRARMARYGISVDVFTTYVADFHGTTVELFEKLEPNQPTNKAVCYDCHGIHNIKQVTDREATVIKENLLATCRKCHPDATANFPASWTSHYQPSPAHYPVVYYVNLFYQLFIPSVVGFFVSFIIVDAGRRFVDRRRKSKAPWEH